MRGALVLLTATFLLGVYYVIVAFAFEPLMVLAEGAPLPATWGTKLTNLQDMVFIYAPMATIFAWGVWALRYYLSPNKYVGGR